MLRRLSTIMAADVVGYSAKMGQSEAETLHQLSDLAELIERHVSRGGGRIFARAADGFLAEFQSPVSSVQAAYQIQRDLKTSTGNQANGLELRIGIHLADVVIDGDNLLGDGVNIAARIEGIAEPGSVFVSQAVFEQVKRTAQLSFEDLGERWLKNISEPVRVLRVAGELGNHSYVSGNPDSVTPKDVQEIDPYSIAVLPFANFSDDPEQEYFSDGFTEDLITDLARFREILVVSRNASFAYKGRNIDIRKVGRELGVAYCLEGSVRKMGPRIRITGQLIDTRSGDHIWAEKYDCTIDDLFDVQDDLTAAIVAKVAARLERQVHAAAKKKKPADMLAYDCLLRGLEYHRLGGVTQESAERALEWFDKAVAKDPQFAKAYAWKSCATATLAREWTRENVLDEALDLARHAVELDDQEPECHRILGSINLYLRDYAKAEYHFRRALELNPNHAFVVGRIGELYNFLGDGRKALDYQKRAVELDPLLPSYCRELEAAAHYVLGDYQETAKVVNQLPRASRRAAAYRAAALAHVGDAPELEAAVRELKAVDPNFTIEAFLSAESYKDPEIPARLREDLNRAGLPAT
ncbi:adenylate/guanylate cyclase domain-containing protein [Roseibium sp.]|uniref:adenylate/guanylate cyclase domain-containing protein n=1 Tax=Roseibium sp. TaxID=1936156 RepID=UPI003D0B5145